MKVMIFNGIKKCEMIKISSKSSPDEKGFICYCTADLRLFLYQATVRLIASSNGIGGL